MVPPRPSARTAGSSCVFDTAVRTTALSARARAAWAQAGRPRPGLRRFPPQAGWTPGSPPPTLKRSTLPTAASNVIGSPAMSEQNGCVHVSAEILTTIVAFATLLAALAGGFGWMIHRTDGRMDRLSDKIGAVGRELVEIKVSIARLEGPPRRLVPAR